MSLVYSETKQTRARELIERREAPSRDVVPGPPQEGTDERVAEIMKHPDYWKRQDLQEQARAILESEDTRELQAADDAATAPAEVLTEWATSLDLEPAEVQGAFDRAQQIVSEIGDTSDLDGAFEGLSDSAQWWTWRTLAQPEKRMQFLGQMDEETYEEIAYLVNNLPENEERAVKRVLGLS